jgi:mRNA interferase RelE/StbE
MPYRIHLSKNAFKAYDMFTEKLKRRLDRCLAAIEINPARGPNVERIRGETGCYRYRVGGWRILYEVDEEASEIRVYNIRPRGDVYKH